MEKDSMGDLPGSTRGCAAPEAAGASSPSVTIPIAELVSHQCRVVCHLATSIALLHTDLASLYVQSKDDRFLESIGERTAYLMESLGDILNGMDGADQADEWMTPIFEQAQRRWPRAAQWVDTPQPSVPEPRQEWHSSEEDGGPDVGVLFRVDDPRSVWCGEISKTAFAEADAEHLGDDFGFFIVLYDETKPQGHTGPSRGHWTDYRLLPVKDRARPERCDMSAKKTYTDFKEYTRDWLRAFRKAGHRPMKIGGRADTMAYASGIHNGPACETCGLDMCMHCAPPWGDIPKCEGAVRKERIQREHEDSVLAEAKEIRARRRAKAATPSDGGER